MTDEAGDTSDRSTDNGDASSDYDKTNRLASIIIIIRIISIISMNYACSYCSSTHPFASNEEDYDVRVKLTKYNLYQMYCSITPV